MLEDDCKHKWGCVDDNIVCMKCALEPDPIITSKSVSFYTRERPKQSDLATIKDLTDLCLDPNVTSTAYVIASASHKKQNLSVKDAKNDTVCMRL